MTSVVGRLVASLRALVRIALGRKPPVGASRAYAVGASCAYEPTKFADTQDLLDDIRATGQTRGLDVRESELDHLPADVRRHFELSSTHERS